MTATTKIVRAGGFDAAAIAAEVAARFGGTSRPGDDGTAYIDTDVMYYHDVRAALNRDPRPLMFMSWLNDE